jgi:ABC-type branched-subunit amino acid transport system ATPase component/ABC-type branched-subunit amino acid transport system permease subunit
VRVTQHLVFLLLGVSSGAVFAALALGLVVTYRSSGVINFATGSIALLTAYTYGYLRQGKLLSLVPGTDKTYDLGITFGLWPALALSLLMAGLLGLLLHLVVFRPLRDAPPVARAVASLGVSVIITSGITARLGTTGVAVEAIYPTGAWTAFGVRISSDRVYFALTILATAIVLSALYRYTRFGLATRAAAESEKGAYVSGISPDRIAAWNWVLSSVVAGLAGILIAPIVPVVPIAYTLFIVPALAAAIMGRFQYLGPAVVAGLVIGMLQSEAQFLQTKYTWLPASGLPELVPLVLVLLVLVVRARPLPSRGAVVIRTLGRAPRPHNLLLAAAVPTVLAVVGLLVLQDRWRAGLITSLIFAVIGLSLVVVTGYAGQVSLAQLTLAGAAGFSLGPLADDLGLPFPIAPLVAAVLATVLGVVVGLPALRIRGLTVAVVTLALAYTLEAVWFRNLDFVSSNGIEIASPKLFGLDLGIGEGAAYPRVQFGLLCLIVLVGVALGVAKLRTSRLGSQMLAVRANERSAAAAGIDVVRVKLAAFAIAAFIAGLGGSLLAYKQSNVTFESYTALGGLALFTTVYLAGITSVSGGILAGIMATGGLLFIGIDEAFSTGIWYEVLSGIGLILTVILNPEGIVGPAHVLVEKRRARRRGRLADLVVGGAVAARDRALRVPDADAATALHVRGMTVRYGGVVAVDGVDLNVKEGLIVGLIGPNGAGKTTLIDALSGLTRGEGGIELAGRDLVGLKPFERTRAGLGRTFQAIELYDDLSVEENVAVGLTAATGRMERPAKDMLADIFGLLGLEQVRDRPAGELSQGQRQLVSIARALAGRPRVLLLDEPAGGLDANESQWLGDRLRDIRDAGITILMVDHDMSLVLSLCDQIHVLNFGRTIATGTPAEIRANREVAAAYLGSTHAEAVTA